jgi:5'-3' exonuclease
VSRRPKSTLVLVDGNNLLVRASYAMQDRDLSTVGVDGEEVPTAALLAAINMLAKHVRLHGPESVVVCWDGGKSEFRQLIYPRYKEHRANSPEIQANRPFSQFKQFLELAGVQQEEVAGWEGDDLIALYCARFREDHELNPDCPDFDRIMIVSDDKDLLQLLGPSPEKSWITQMRLPGVYPGDFWDLARVQREYGCLPAQLVSLMALTGDPGDGVPGLRGVGPKKGVKRLREHSYSWPAVLRSVEEDYGPEGRDVVVIARQLVDLIETPYRKMGLVADLRPPYLFWPTAAGPGDDRWAALEGFLLRYRMDTVLAQIKAGHLWSMAGPVE